MKIDNKYRFWTGIGMFGVEILAVGIFGLTLIDWDFLTIKLAMIVLVAIFVLCYNFLAQMLIWSGSKKPRQEK